MDQDRELILSRDIVVQNPRNMEVTGAGYRMEQFLSEC
jgi:hypothetical protein